MFGIRLHRRDHCQNRVPVHSFNDFHVGHSRRAFGERAGFIERHDTGFVQKLKRFAFSEENLRTLCTEIEARAGQPLEVYGDRRSQEQDDVNQR